MKSIAKAILLIISILATATPAFSLDAMMWDPFALLRFDPAKPVYESVTKADYAKFRLRDGPWWIFARYIDQKDNAKEYLVLSGLIRPCFDTEPITYGELEPDFGFICYVEDSKVTTLGVADVIDDDSIGLPDRVITGLLDDYVARSLTGFGTKEHISAETEKRSKHPWMLRAVAEAFERAGIRIPPECVMKPTQRTPKE